MSGLGQTPESFVVKLVAWKLFAAGRTEAPPGPLARAVVVKNVATPRVLIMIFDNRERLMFMGVAPSRAEGDGKWGQELGTSCDRVRQRRASRRKVGGLRR